MLDKELLAPLSPWARNEVLRAFADLTNQHKDELKEVKRATRYRYDEGIDHAITTLLPALDTIGQLWHHARRLKERLGRVTKDDLEEWVIEPARLAIKLKRKCLHSLDVAYVPGDCDDFYPRFDPNTMLAVDRRFTNDHAHNTVVEIPRLGFRRGLNLLREAHVVVSAQEHTQGKEVPYEA